MRRTWEKELLQQLCNRSRRTTAGLDFFCHFLQVIDNTLAFIQTLNLLREIGDTNSFPNHNLTCCRLKTSCNQVEESWFPNTVVPNNSNTIFSLYQEIKILQNGLVFIGKGNTLKLDDFLPNPTGFKVHGQVCLSNATWDFFLQVMETIDTSLLLGCTRLRLSAHPGQFLFVELFFFVEKSCIALVLFRLKANIVLIISLVLGQVCAIQFENPSWQSV